eukprot:7067327-Pyramimonas_sp.AAC.1
MPDGLPKRFVGRPRGGSGTLKTFAWINQSTHRWYTAGDAPGPASSGDGSRRQGGPGARRRGWRRRRIRRRIRRSI